MGEKFVSHFVSKIAHKKTSITLISIQQRPDEPLRDFITRFNNETLQVKDLDHTVAIAAFTNGLRDKDFTTSLTKKPLKILIAEKCINVKAAMWINYQGRNKATKGRTRRKVSPKWKKFAMRLQS